LPNTRTRTDFLAAQRRERALHLLRMADEYPDHDVSSPRLTPRNTRAEPLTEFRFYFLNDQDHIVLGETLDVLDLEAAVQAAYQACHDHPRFSSSRIEVWQGTSRLYSS
jgi:hypothetical protein